MNLERFPEDFLFLLTDEEVKSLNIQMGNSKMGKGGRRYTPFAFTENGVAMLSSVLSSKTAIQINISIMRTFTNLRSFLSMENSINNKMEKLENNTTKVFQHIFKRLDNIEDLLTPSLPTIRKKIGLKNDI